MGHQSFLKNLDALTAVFHQRIQGKCLNQHSVIPADSASIVHSSMAFIIAYAKRHCVRFMRVSSGTGRWWMGRIP